jgi:hypothetical protein
MCTRSLRTSESIKWISERARALACTGPAQTVLLSQRVSGQRMPFCGFGVGGESSHSKKVAMVYDLQTRKHRLGSTVTFEVNNARSIFGTSCFSTIGSLGAIHPLSLSIKSEVRPARVNVGAPRQDFRTSVSGFRHAALFLGIIRSRRRSELHSTFLAGCPGLPATRVRIETVLYMDVLQTVVADCQPSSCTTIFGSRIRNAADRACT